MKKINALVFLVASLMMPGTYAKPKKSTTHTNSYHKRFGVIFKKATTNKKPLFIASGIACITGVSAALYWTYTPKNEPTDTAPAPAIQPDVAGKKQARKKPHPILTKQSNHNTDLVNYTIPLVERYAEVENIPFDTVEDVKEHINKIIKEKPVLDKIIGALFGMIIGDATGAPLEFLPIQNIGSHKFELSQNKHISPHPSFNLKPGQWTDDASMGLAMADSIIENNEFDGTDIRLRFWAWWHNGYCNAFGNDTKNVDKRSIGLGGNIGESLNEVYKKLKKGEPISPTHLSPGENNNSGNGSLMRLVPIVLFCHQNQEDCLAYAEQSSWTTHPGYDASESCKLLAYIIFRSIQRTKEESKQTTKEWLEQVLNDYQTTCLTKLQNVSNETKKAKENKNSLNSAKEKINRLINASEDKNGKEANWNWKVSHTEYTNNIVRAFNTRNTSNLYNGHPVSSTYWGSYAIDGIAGGINGVYNATNFGEAIANTANLLGDADSTASIGGQMAGAIYGIKNLLDAYPKLFDQVYQWDKGRSVIRAILLADEKRLNKHIQKLQSSKKPIKLEPFLTTFSTK
ncbi:MAG: ADP-ribosylglycohydrolase family protein [Bacteroidota bacterium]